jgi:GMP synthase (glutamine-hydrolysing)
MKPFLILQLRPETAASDDEFAAFLAKGGLRAEDVHRIRLDQQDIPQDFDLDEYSGVIVGGGPGCVSDPDDKKTAVEKRIETAVLGLMPDITARDFPFMGCCYGIGILAHHLGAVVSKDKYSEPVGAVTCSLTPAGQGDAMLAGLPDRFRAFVGHKEAAQTLPAGCAHLASSPTCPYQIIRFGQNVYATQFHPEADSDGFAVRIGIYKHRGYFPAHEADALIAMCHSEEVHMPERILRNFVQHYRRDSG